MAKTAPQLYQSFLVRCWLIPAAATEELPQWRFEVQTVSPDSIRKGLGDLELVTAYITAHLAGLAAHHKVSYETQTDK